MIRVALFCLLLCSPALWAAPGRIVFHTMPGGTMVLDAATGQTLSLAEAGPTGHHELQLDMPTRVAIRHEHFDTLSVRIEWDAAQERWLADGVPMRPNHRFNLSKTVQFNVQPDDAVAYVDAGSAIGENPSVSTLELAGMPRRVTPLARNSEGWIVPSAYRPPPIYLHRSGYEPRVLALPEGALDRAERKVPAETIKLRSTAGTLVWPWILLGVAGAAGAWMLRKSRPAAPPAPAPPPENAVPVVVSLNSTLAVGTSLGEYRIVSFLARGGMASVYKVENSFGDTFALKIPDARVVTEDDFRLRFTREIEMVRNLHHPAIVRIFDYRLGDDDNALTYVVMELIQGEVLSSVLEREGAIEAARALTIIKPVLEALDYTHQRDILHRDIKPGNIMVTHQGAVKLMDFGIARPANSAMTRSDVALGTPLYMAPEQLYTPKGIGPTADIYAVGVVLYQMLTGHVPYNHPDYYALVTAKITEDPPRLSIFLPQAPPSLQRLIDLSVARLPEDRFQSARQFLEALEQVDLSGLSLLAPQRAPTESLQPPEPH